MINYTSDPTEAAWKGYFYALMLFVTAAVQSLCLHQYFQSCIAVGMRIRTTLIAAVYRKVGIIRRKWHTIIITYLLPFHFSFLIHLHHFISHITSHHHLITSITSSPPYLITSIT